ncbi:hypothetical protein SEUCBS140593_010408 [Sporothrix eucalyptigena]|uniref:MADS-box domain-containing protein n=1 Tax=Sporothrix eucalyptigena TaxID=1812306 RepID=A0ABP0D196_9PEZI
MAEKPNVKRHNRMLRRNLEGLLSKCHRYGQLRGVELGIYIDYTERGQFVSYETQNFCRNEITAKVPRSSLVSELPPGLSSSRGPEKAYWDCLSAHVRSETANSHIAPSVTFRDYGGKSWSHGDAGRESISPEQTSQSAQLQLCNLREQ